MTKKYIKEIARQILHCEIFGTWLIPIERRTPDNIRMIFLPLALSDCMEDIDPNDIAHAFAPYTNQWPGSRSINGFPMFSSVQFIMWDDWKQVVKIVKAAQEAEDKILNQEPINQ